MKNISKKIISTLMLTAFVFTNSLLTVSAMENASKPVLRNGNEFSLKLKGDISYIKSKEPVSLSLRDSDVKQVLRMFADKAGLNIIFHDSVDGKVTMDLVDVPLSDAFDMIMDINGLSYVVQDKTIIIAKSGTDGFNIAKQDMTLIPVKYVSANALADFLNKSIFGMNKPGLSNKDVVTTNPATNELIVFGSPNDVAIAKKVVEKFDKKPTTTSFKVNYTTPAEMAQMICDMLLPATGSDGATGGAAGIMTGAAASSGSGSGGSGKSLKLNAGTVACSSEGKMEGSFGLQNFTIAYIAQLGTVNVIGGSENQLEMIKDFISQMDKKQPQAYIEFAIIELSETGSKELHNTWNFLSNSLSLTFDGQTTGTPMTKDLSHPIFIRGDGYASDYSEGTHNVNKYGGPVNISLAIRYIISNSKGRVVANPRILVTNGETSKIEITDDYIETTDVSQSVYSGGVVNAITYNVGSDAGTTIEVTPFISPDGYVTMNIKPEYTVVGETVPGKTDSGIEYIAATLLKKKNLDLKNVRIKDGETLVIAGMINETESKTVGKVPILGDIPGLGMLFRDTTSKKTKSEMVIMITPKIVTDTEDSVGNADTL